MNIREKLIELGYHESVSKLGHFHKSFAEHLPGSFKQELFVSIILEDNKVADAYVTAGNELYQVVILGHMDFVKIVFGILENDLKELSECE